MTGLVSMMTSEYSSIPNFSSADGTVEASKKNFLLGREENGGDKKRHAKSTCTCIYLYMYHQDSLPYLNCSKA